MPADPPAPHHCAQVMPPASSVQPPGQRPLHVVRRCMQRKASLGRVDAPIERPQWSPSRSSKQGSIESSRQASVAPGRSRHPPGQGVTEPARFPMHRRSPVVGKPKSAAQYVPSSRVRHGSRDGGTSKPAASSREGTSNDIPASPSGAVSIRGTTSAQPPFSAQSLSGSRQGSPSDFPIE